MKTKLNVQRSQVWSRTAPIGPAQLDQPRSSMAQPGPQNCATFCNAGCFFFSKRAYILFYKKLGSELHSFHVLKWEKMSMIYFLKKSQKISSLH